VAPGELDLLGIDEPEIVVTNPLTVDESRLRRSLLPGLLRAVGQNDERRVEAISLFEIGATFVHPSAVSSPRAARAGSAGGASVDVPVEPEHATLLLARDGDDASSAVASLRVLEQALGLAGLRLENVSEITAEAAGLHPTRAARVLDRATGSLVGVVGEVDPGLVEELAPGSKGRRIGIVDLDLDVLADTERCLRKDATASLVSRFPSSDVDLAFALSDEVPADRLIDAVAASVGDLAESVRLFDVYRGDGLALGERSLALRCRLCSQDRTLTDSDLAAARDAMIAAAASLGAVLR
jgi:phenylalanyl-tRNA synthetase beta chain